MLLQGHLHLGTKTIKSTTLLASCTTANFNRDKNSIVNPVKWAFISAAVSLVHGGHYANFSGCLGPFASPEFIIIIARHGWECCKCEPETSGSFFSMKSIFREIPRMFPIPALKKHTERRSAPTRLWFSMCTCMCTRLDWLYYVLE